MVVGLNGNYRATGRNLVYGIRRYEAGKGGGGKRCDHNNEFAGKNI